MSTDATVALLPGLTCDERFWAAPVAALADRAVTIPRFHDHDSLAGMAAALLDDTDGPLDVVGHSMGGRVALEVWALAPERVRSLVLLDTGVHPVGPDEPARRQVLIDLADEGGVDAVAEQWIPMMIHPDRRDDRELTGEIRAMVTSYSVDQYRGQVRALLGRRDAGPLLPTITCPTLVACGDHDAWSPPDQHREIADAIAGARLEFVTHAGHMIAMERPAATTELLIDWLASR